jgi:bifunctional non-homologous end joining protein LigD
VTVLVDAGSRQVEISSEDKIFFPDAGISKGDLAEYYNRVGDIMLPHVVDRALTLHRFPDGIEGEGFFQKETPDYFPEWISRAPLAKEGGTVVYPVCTEKATLVYLVDQGCITPHVWLSRTDRPENPDRMVFDLDPPDDSEDLGLLHDTARGVRDSLDDLGVPSFVMTTGSAGYHVLVPLDASVAFDDVRAVSRRLAERVVQRFPDSTTVEQRKDRRDGKIFIDYLRNSYAQTTVAPYAVRALPRAPVATPIRWDELADSTPRTWTLDNIFRRLGQIDDPWQDLSGIDGVAAGDIAAVIDQQKDENGPDDR